MSTFDETGFGPWGGLINGGLIFGGGRGGGDGLMSGIKNISKELDTI